MKNYTPTLLLLLWPFFIQAQINAYARVTSVSGASFTLSNVNQTYHTFSAGEQIIVMQMQDTVLGANTINDSTFGTIANIANAGKYEVATIGSVAGMPSSLTITAPLANIYNTNASVQIISFNLLGASGYTTSSNITGLAWNGSVGGIVAFQVKGKLTLANAVNADGLGFRGGAVNTVSYELRCEPGVYDTTSPKYGFKGEGILFSPTITYTSHTGRAPLANGGGGGSDDNGGGGGGGNYTSGGSGGEGYSCTVANASGGLGGAGLTSYSSGSRIFMGGGGGGGQQNNTVATAGKAGGGIILIKADSVTTNCSGGLSISASGLSVPGNGNDGAGGAGGGGTIILHATYFIVPPSCPLTVQANGGNGGNVSNPNSHGGGGGGGQGTVVFPVAIPTINVSAQAANGTGGLNSSGPGASHAGSGGGTSDAGVVVSGSVLNLEFYSFSATRKENSVLVSWSAGGSDRPVTFHVQRAEDGINFQTVADLNGSADGKSNYSFTDIRPFTGIAFYRIEAIDPSGKNNYSTIALVRMEGDPATFSIFPNPSDGRFSIRVNAPGDPYCMVTIGNLAGETVYAQVCRPSNGLVNISAGKRFPGGIYIVCLNIGGGITRLGKLLIR